MKLKRTGLHVDEKVFASLAKAAAKGYGGLPIKHHEGEVLVLVREEHEDDPRTGTSEELWRDISQWLAGYAAALSEVK